MFYGIQIVTQNYINPAVDIVKKKGIMSSETLNVTLLALTNSAAESFIIINSIFFGVSDIGIACVVQQAAFYALVNQSKFRFEVKLLLRHVLLDCSGGNIYWLVDRDKRNLFIFALLSNNHVLPLRQLGLAYRSNRDVFLLLFACYSDDQICHLRGNNQKDPRPLHGNRRTQTSSKQRNVSFPLVFKIDSYQHRVAEPNKVRSR